MSEDTYLDNFKLIHRIKLTLTIGDIFTALNFHSNNHLMNLAEKRKIVLVGDSGIGKTTLLQSYTQLISGEQLDQVKATVSPYQLKHQICGFQTDIVDTCGAERFQSITPIYFRHATCILIVFDVTDLKSYQRALWWEVEASSIADDASVLIVGNKIDIPLSCEMQKELDQFEQDLKQKGVDIMFCSAKQGKNVQQVFEKAAQKGSKEIHKRIGFELSKSQFIENTRPGCCE